MEGAREGRRDQTSSLRPNNPYCSPLDLSPPVAAVLGLDEMDCGGNPTRCVPDPASQTPHTTSGRHSRKDVGTCSSRAPTETWPGTHSSRCLHMRIRSQAQTIAASNSHAVGNCQVKEANAHGACQSRMWEAKVVMEDRNGGDRSWGRQQRRKPGTI
jgi:hypothetical protein